MSSELFSSIETIFFSFCLSSYYVNGRTATAEQFMDPYILDTFKDELDVAFNILKETNPEKPLWLGETSSAFGGGSPGLSDTYIAGFM